MNLTALTSLATDLAVRVDLPNIEPDTSSNFAQAAISLAAIVLGVGAILCLMALGVCFVILAFKGFGNSRALEMAGTGVMWSLGGLVGLGSLTGIAAWAVNFQIF